MSKALLDRINKIDSEINTLKNLLIQELEYERVNNKRYLLLSRGYKLKISKLERSKQQIISKSVRNYDADKKARFRLETKRRRQAVLDFEYKLQQLTHKLNEELISFTSDPQARDKSLKNIQTLQNKISRTK